MVLLVNIFMQEQYVPTKTELAEAICCLSKQFTCTLLDEICLNGQFIKCALQTIVTLVQSLHLMKQEYTKLLYQLAWTLGILNSEKNEYSNLFIEYDGIKVLLNLIEVFAKNTELC